MSNAEHYSSPSVRKYVMIVCALALLVLLGFTALMNGDGETLAQKDVDGIAMVADGDRVKGNCREFSNKYFACAPSKTPKGSPITKLYEDGSARYKNGATFNGDSGRFEA